MTFLESLALYTASQKVVAYGFVTVGVLLLLSALGVFMLSPTTSPFWQGFKVGALVFGLVILLGGIGYLNFSGKIHNQIEAEYKTGTDTALVAENKRMNKVVSDFKIYQLAFACIVLLSLAAVLFAKPYWSGFAFPSTILFVLVLLIEAYSKHAIDRHAEMVVSFAGGYIKE